MFSIFLPHPLSLVAYLGSRSHAIPLPLTDTGGRGVCGSTHGTLQRKIRLRVVASHIRSFRPVRPCRAPIGIDAAHKVFNHGRYITARIRQQGKPTRERTCSRRLPVLPPIHFSSGGWSGVDIQRDRVATVDIVLFTHHFARTHEQVDWTIYMTFKELVVHMGAKGELGNVDCVMDQTRNEKQS